MLGGTFNPPHRGHVALARCARERLGLDRVALMPLHTPPHKPGGEDPGARARLRMCELAVAGQAGMRACALEVERGGTSYTVDTMSALHDIDESRRLTLIVGADTALTMGSWREPARLLELAEVAVALRGETTRERVLEALAAVDADARVRFVEMERVDVASSQVRDLAARGEPVNELVGERVAGYIAEHGLYRARVGVAGA